MLERLLKTEAARIKRVVPGEIKVIQAHGQGHRVDIRVTTPLMVNQHTQNGWKAIALASGSKQEVFVSTTLSRPELETAFAAAGADVKTGKSTGVGEEEEG